MDCDLHVINFINDKISLWSPNGRVKINYSIPDYFKSKFNKDKIKMAKLILQNGKFWLHCSIEEIEPNKQNHCGFLGIDQGQVFLVSDSEGEQYEGKTLQKISNKYKTRRESLSKSKFQKKTRAKARVWKKLSEKESRFIQDVNHQISKRIVQKAKNLKQCIVLEDLKDFFEDIKVRRENRFMRRSWAFAQLIFFIQYKALKDGVRCILVNPAYTSQQCNNCSYTDSKNRKSQSLFKCIKCGYVNYPTHKGWGFLFHSRSYCYSVQRR
jgi:IS605 OrfB family transposase